MLPAASPAPIRPAAVPLAAGMTSTPVSAFAADDLRANMPPVSEASARDGARLGAEDSSRPLRDALQVTHRHSSRRASLVGTEKVPQDRAMFRAKVIRLLTVHYQDDQAFLRALKQGTIVIHAVEDQDKSDLRPEISYERYRLSAQQTLQLHRPIKAARPLTVGPHDFIAWWPNRH